MTFHILCFKVKNELHIIRTNYRTTKHVTLELHVPNVCTESPAHNSVFCEEHLQALKVQGFEAVGTKEFITHCGANPNKYDKVKFLKPIFMLIDQNMRLKGIVWLIFRMFYAENQLLTKHNAKTLF